MSESLFLPDEGATRKLGAALAAGIAPGRVIFLRGDLGTGKTTLIQGLIRSLGFSGRVKSPTYSLVELYKLSSLNLYHFDFYRFEDRSEWVDLGFREYFNRDSACAVEWPERVAGLLAPPDLELRLELCAAGRQAYLAPHTAAGRDWLGAALRRWSQA